LFFKLLFVSNFIYDNIDEITRDYQSTVTDLEIKDAMLYPWDEGRLNLDEIQDDWVEKCTKELESAKDEKPTTNGLCDLQIKRSPPFAVYTTSQYKKNITNKNFYIEEDQEKADILYIEGHYREME